MKEAKRFVVKVGSTLVTNRGAGLDASAIARWAGQVAKLRQAGKELVLVPSGAVAEGMQRLGWTRHALGDRTARDQDQLLAGLAKLGDLSRPARDGGRVQPRAPVGDEGAADFDDETLRVFHSVFPDSRKFITAKLSSRQPSPVSAEMQKLGPRQRSLRTSFAATVLCSSAGSISILFSTSQRGFR